MSAFKIFIATAALVAAMPATAATIINFDTLPGGATIANNTPITNQYASLGVVFSASATSGATGAPVATTYSAGPVTPPYYSGNYLANEAAEGLLSQRWDTLTMTFVNPVSGVSFGLNSFSTQGYVTFKAYDSVGTLLQTAVLLQNGGWGLSALSATNISRIDVTPSYIYNVTTAIYGIDNLTYTVNPITAVPEPATWGMMILGFGLAGGAMRRRTVRPAVTYA